MKNINDMSPLSIELPEDILKAKWCGDFSRARRLIAAQLGSGKTPECLKERLRLEEHILDSLAEDYIYTEEEALALMRQRIPDFTEGEFQSLIDSSAIDWIYIHGRLHACRKFLDTLLKVHPDLAARAGEPTGETPGRQLLNQNCLDMKTTGGANWHFHLRATLTIADSAFQPGKRVLVHLPLPAPARNCTNIRILSHTPGGKVGGEEQLQRTISFEEIMEKNHPFTVEYEYDSPVGYVELDPHKAVPGVLDFDVEEQPPHIRFTPFIRALCAELKGELDNPILIARKFYDYCTTNVTYSYMRRYFGLTQIPDYCALGRKGDCGVQALLFITLCRCAGIPARWQSGSYVTPYEAGPHDWAEFYVEPYGWVFADCSFGGSAYRAGNSLRHNHYFGNLDPFRMVANSAFQAPLFPEKAQLRIDPYDNQVGEVEYENRGLNWNEVEFALDVVDCYKL